MRQLMLLMLVGSLGLCQTTLASAEQFDRDMFYVPQDAPAGTWALMEKAAQLAAKDADCVQVTGGAWSTKAQAAADGSHSKEQFYVQCQSSRRGPVPGVSASFNLYYSYEDLRQGTVKHRATPIGDKQAIAECRQAIISRLRYPSSAHMVLVRYGANGTENNLVVYDFTTLNGFGNRIPQKGTCVIDPSNSMDVSITNR